MVVRTSNSQSKSGSSSTILAGKSPDNRFMAVGSYPILLVSSDGLSFELGGHLKLIKMWQFCHTATCELISLLGIASAGVCGVNDTH